MTKLSLIALTAMLAIGGVAAPVLAAPETAPGNVPFCATGNTDNTDLMKQTLSEQLQLSTKQGSSIDVWNGCLKVTTTEAGKTNIAFYDPDSLKLVATI
jgi:hypothetical protein